ncbi:MAG: DUF1579 domain-containing protein [Planctomycetota bacterium]
MFRHKIWSAIALLCLALLTAVAGNLQSQDPQPSDEEKKMQEAMERWMATMNPGDQHAALEPMVGEFTATTKMWMDPSAEPMVSTGSCKNTWILGKRFVQSSFKGTMTMPGENGQMHEMPFEGIATTGYDRYRNIYVSTWIDNMSTSMWISRGTTPDGKVFNFYGEMDEPMMNITGRMVKETIRIVDKDTHVMEMFDLAAGDNYKVMQITYKRAKTND